MLIICAGWGTAELVGTKVLPLWFGARGIEFDWRYIQSSLDSNVNLVRIRIILKIHSYCLFDLIFSGVPVEHLCSSVVVEQT